MNELELAQHTADVTRWVAYFGFALWGAAGWYVGRFFLKKNYIKPTGLINMRVVRQIENDNFKKNAEIAELKMEKHDLFTDVKELYDKNKELTDHNKRLWYWSYQPHRDTHTVIIKQLDKNGEKVAYSDATLPERKHWVEPMYYVDDMHESYEKWHESLPHNKEEGKS